MPWTPQSTKLTEVAVSGSSRLVKTENVSDVDGDATPGDYYLDMIEDTTLLPVSDLSA